MNGPVWPKTLDQPPLLYDDLIIVVADDSLNSVPTRNYLF